MAEIEGMHPGLPDAVLMDVQATGRLPEQLANSIDTRIQLLMSANLSRSKRHTILTEVRDCIRESVEITIKSLPCNLSSSSTSPSNTVRPLSKSTYGTYAILVP